ncbi:hypothetical protein AX768_31350 (plasmid) [Burkholderia sp. PAMC 28687]|nr:hypothetical protein AX768_31350 [Burkholderia sp. PAMC 28687]
MMFYALRHAVDSFVRVSKNAPKKSPANMTLRAFCRAAMSSSALRALRALITAAVTATQHQQLRIYRNDVALTQQIPNFIGLIRF